LRALIPGQSDTENFQLQARLGPFISQRLKMEAPSLMPATSSNLSTPEPLSSRRELRERRISELLESCRTQTLAQITGPFGLSPAMFDDKQGGNVTTTHNFEKGHHGDR